MRTIDEREIHNLLLASQDNTRVADQLIKLWHLGEVNYVQVNSISYFLIHCKFIPSLFNESILSLEKKGWVSWEAILYAVINTLEIQNTAKKLQEDFFQSLFSGAKNRNQEEQLCRNQKFWDFSPIFQQEFQKAFKKKEQQKSSEKEELLKKLELYVNEHMEKQAIRLLKRLKKKYPEDKEIAQLHKNYLEKDALNLFTPSESKQKSLEILKLEKKWNQLSPKEMLAKEALVDCILKSAKQDISQAYELSIALSMMGFNKEALKCLQLCSPAKKVAWLEIELLIQLKKYLLALEKLKDIEKNTEGPDDIYAQLYYEAICLWGLHRSNEALAILENIIENKPNYRSAQSMFQYWQRMLEQ